MKEHLKIIYLLDQHLIINISYCLLICERYDMVTHSSVHKTSKLEEIRGRLVKYRWERALNQGKRRDTRLPRSCLSEDKCHWERGSCVGEGGPFRRLSP